MLPTFADNHRCLNTIAKRIANLADNGYVEEEIYIYGSLAKNQGEILLFVF